MDERRKELFSERVTAGRRTYFFDVKESANGDKYLTISESWRDNEDRFEHSRVMVFEEYVPESYDGIRQAIRFIAGKEQAYSVEQIRRQHPRAYARWTEDKDRLLTEKHGQGRTIDELAEQLGRQPSAIRSRLQRLGQL
jgi:DNA-directed RNA polymerase specialized sigma24 family protein